MEFIALLLLFAGLYYFWKVQKKPPIEVTQTTTRYADLDEQCWDVAAEYAPSDPKPVGGLLKLKYEDAEGRVTEREVQVRECDTTNPAGYLTGHCRLRNEFRTFRMDRIKRAIDMETGEVLDDLPAWALAHYEASPAYAMEELLSTATDALRALFYIGKADGRFTKKEKAVFLQYCQAQSGADHITLADIDRACASLPLPSMQAFKLICGRLAKLDTSNRNAVLEACELMVATEKKIAPEEAEALAYMRKRIGQQEGNGRLASMPE